MAAFKNFLSRLTAHPRWCALALGALAAGGFQPLALWPLTLLAVAGLIELIARAGSWKQAALLAWLFGVGHFTIGNNWIATAFTYQANMPAWLGWVAVVVLSLYLAAYPALAALAAWLIAGHRRIGANPPFPSRAGRGVGAVGLRFASRTGPTPSPLLKRRGLALAFAATWIVTEWLRSWVFTGFAWNPLGMVLLGQFDNQGLAWIAPWTGTYGLSGIVVLFAGALLNAPSMIAEAQGRSRAIRVVGLLVLLGLLASISIKPFDLPGESGTIPFTLVQPDVRQEVLDDPAHWEDQFAKTAWLTQARTTAPRRLVLWPESGIPDYLRGGYPPRVYAGSTYGGDPALARQRIGRAIGPGSLLLTGAVDLEIRGGNVVAARNAITALDAEGRIRGGYAKAHLVPYGEYLPLRPLLEPLGLSRLVPGILDFWPGPGPRTLDLGPWGKAGMQICYEIVFSGQVVDPGRRPDFIFNPSNDGWFGSWGPPQHLAQARLRAIEEGLPVLRSTTTGISAVIDADGFVRQHIRRHTAARLDGTIPPAHSLTPFARLGNLLPLVWAVVLLVLSVVAMRRRGG